MKKLFIMLVIFILMVTGCGKDEKEQEGPTILTLAVFGSNSKVTEQVNLFNQSHTDCQIQIVEYTRSDNLQEDGIAKMQREIVSGKGPDIIDYGTGFTFSDISGNYTEDLRPYLEAEKKASGMQYFDNIFKSFSYQGRLRAVPISFAIDTFAGSQAQLGNRTCWNVAEMMETYLSMEGRLLYPGEMKTDVFGSILSGSMDYYIDWETGECRFDSEEFVQVLQFANLFPETLHWAEDMSVKQMYEDGEALLWKARMSNIYDICKAEYFFEDPIYIGYPVAGESGTIINPKGSVFAISIHSKDKEASWEFVRQFLALDYQEELTGAFPVCKTALEEILAENLEPQYITGEDGQQEKEVRGKLIFDGEDTVPLYNVPEEQAERLLGLIESAKLCSTVDTILYFTLLEEVGSYFAGDKPAEEVAKIMQSKAVLYVSERMSPGDYGEGMTEDDVQDNSTAGEETDGTVADGLPESTPNSGVDGSTGDSEASDQPGENTGTYKPIENVVFEKSMVEKKVTYQGENFLKSVFATGGDRLYVGGTKEDGSYFLGTMLQEENVFQELQVTIPEGMRILRMFVDKQGNCHALWMSMKISGEGVTASMVPTYEQCYITIVTPEGEVVKQIDLAGIFGAKIRMPYYFVTDFEGNYWIENEQQVLKISQDGKIVDRIDCGGYVEGIGVGKSGAVYVVYSSKDGKTYLGKIDGSELSETTEIPTHPASYALIISGVDSEVVLYNKVGGIYTFIGGALTLQVTEEDLPMGREDIYGYGMLGDGRLCLFGAEGDGMVFHYVPIEN